MWDFHARQMNWVSLEWYLAPLSSMLNTGAGIILLFLHVIKLKNKFAKASGYESMAISETHLP